MDSICIGNSMICSDIWHEYTRSDISKLLYVILRAARRVKFETILKHHESGIYAKHHVLIMLLFVYTTTHKRVVIFTCRYFKLS